MLSLSIVTPTLNSSKTLFSTLLSLAPLVQAGAEHIVVDSYSDDGTIDIAKTFGSKIISCPPGNMYAAINKGLSTASGDWLTYINSDDLLFSDYVIEVLAGASLDDSIIYGDIDYIDSAGRFLFSRRSAEPCYLANLMKYYNPFPQQGTLFKRELFTKMYGFNTKFRYAADYDFFARCCSQGEVFRKFKSKSVAAFRLSPDQLSQSARDMMAPEGIHIRKELLQTDRNLPYWLEKILSSLYRWSTNVDGIVLRELRGRRQDSGWR